MKSNSRHYLEMDKMPFTQPNLHQIQLPGGVLESSGQADSKTVPGFDEKKVI